MSKSIVCRDPWGGKTWAVTNGRVWVWGFPTRQHAREYRRKLFHLGDAIEEAYRR